MPAISGEENGPSVSLIELQRLKISPPVEQGVPPLVEEKPFSSYEYRPQDRLPSYIITSRSNSLQRSLKPRV